MKLSEALLNKRHVIVDKWVDYTLETYQASAFFRREKDAFANPVGSMVRTSLAGLFRALRENDTSRETLTGALSQIMHLRSVQEFTPSQAIAPIHAVKHITRDVLSADKETRELVGDLYDFEFGVDLAVLAAFDLYVDCREKIYSIRISELKSGSSVLTDGACPSRKLQDIKEIKE